MVTNPVRCIEPSGSPVPVVLDSPHSGRQYPPDFRTRIVRSRLQQLEDGFVDELFANAPSVGATLIAAEFPRTYIDPNRAIDDIDQAALANPWPGLAQPTQKALLGVGLVFTKTPEAEPLYNAALSATEVQTRIERCYVPYHSALSKQLLISRERFGTVWHINCHSMPSHAPHASASIAAKRRPDFCLGNRYGASCTPELTHAARTFLQAHGYVVTVNDPYAGLEVLQRHGAPERGVHSLQLEINRDLYMCEHNHQRHSGFTALQTLMTAMVQRLSLDWATCNRNSPDNVRDAAE
jgi:N-formylglutamate deformylase